MREEVALKINLPESRVQVLQTWASASTEGAVFALRGFLAVQHVMSFK